MDDKLEYEVLGFDDVHFVDVIANVVSACDTFVLSLDQKPLADSLKYAFIGLNESLPVIIAFNLDNHQEEKLLDLLRENKETLGMDIREHQWY